MSSKGCGRKWSWPNLWMTCITWWNTGLTDDPHKEDETGLNIFLQVWCLFCKSFSDLHLFSCDTTVRIPSPYSQFLDRGNEIHWRFINIQHYLHPHKGHQHEVHVQVNDFYFPNQKVRHQYIPSTEILYNTCHINNDPLTRFIWGKS
jgi:hypothetical protein